jgi:hypothetical protein
LAATFGGLTCAWVPLDHGQRSALARPCRCKGLVGEHTKALVRPLRPCLDVLDDDGHRLADCRPLRLTNVLYRKEKTMDETNAPPTLKITTCETCNKSLASRQEEICG